jgi:hypothetical protein
MNEWYVLSIGYLTASTPQKAILGRVQAVREFAEGFRMTPAEKRRMALFLEGTVCDLGSGLSLVGYTKDDGEVIPDRKLTRVLGPGTEV